ncbi:MAG: efflux RND transporter permease subunit [Pseudoxanthomonas sp.]
MLGLVRTALKKPYTFLVLALFICIVGPLAMLRTPTDVLPDIGIPVIAAVFQYTGLSPAEMAGRVVTPYERALTTTVNDVEHVESQSLPGMGVVKIYFQPDVDIRMANAQVTAISQTLLKQMPAGMTPPLILNYSASTVPILQMAFSSPTLGESEIRDIAMNQVRPQLTTIAGLAMPSPYGGKQAQITLDLDPQAMAAKGLSAQDVANALAAQNQITPVGTAKLGRNEFTVLLNNSPEDFQAFNDLPIKTVDGATVTIGQVAHVRNGFQPQTNLVRVDGRHSVLMSAMKNGKVSTLTLVSQLRALLPQVQKTLPESLRIATLGDASGFVRRSVSSVAREGILAALLTSAMILLFLGSWRSTLIIAVSIPLAVMAAIALLSVFDQTLNVMTLGGLALAVGILVDDATVTIENVNWHLEQGKPVKKAILDGAKQIVGPAFVSLLCICIVFVPMFLLDGIAGYLFRPMALAVIFAMGSSFILSRTLVPTLAMYLLKPHDLERGRGQHPEDAFINHHEGDQPPCAGVRGRWLATAVRLQQRFETGFSRVRDRYYALLEGALAARKPFVIGFLGCVLLSFALLPALGQDFFPTVESDGIALHVRLPLGMRIEETAALAERIEQRIRQVIPPAEVDAVIDNLGLPITGINVAYSASGTIGPQDGDIQVSLKPGHGDTAGYVKRLREVLPAGFPGATFAFLPADISSQILNFGTPAPLDVRISGGKDADSRAYAAELLRRLRTIPGVADLRLQQSTGYPTLKVDVDRLRASALGITERDVTNSMVASLASTGQVAPTYWLNPGNNITYAVAAATPQYRLDSMAALQALPVTGSDGQSQVLAGLAQIRRLATPAVVSHYNVAPTLDLYADVQGRDLGAVAADIQKALDATASMLPKGASVGLHGQIDALHVAFTGLGYGLLGAIVLIYLLIVVNFQSWSDPFVIITALPAGLAGVVWMLFLTHTTLSVPALTGAIMCMGVATANSILVVSFCRERLAVHGDAAKAALEAGFTRFRPVCMTALAMILGMLPTALSAEQNAPLGRAVIGGLLLATAATLLFVPVVFAIVHARHPRTDSATAGEPAHAV